MNVDNQQQRPSLSAVAADLIQNPITDQSDDQEPTLTTDQPADWLTDWESDSIGQPESTDTLPYYWREWQDSCVADAIIASNVRYADREQAVDLLTLEAIANMGGWAQQYATSSVIKLRQRYQHVEAGGWYVSGLDPLNNWERMDWGQFKPITPRTSYKNPDKIIKYETPPKAAQRAIFLAGGIDWRQIQENVKVPRLWTEGAKKAGAALSLGFAAVALPGINSGYRVKDVLGNPVAPYLLPDVAAVAQPGSIHYLAFDQDDKMETRRKVAIALSRFGQLLEEAGCVVKIVRWSATNGKGLDDLIAANGPEAFHKAVKDALTFEEWRLWQVLDNRLTLAPAIRLTVSDLTVLKAESVPDTGIIAIASAKGTGKTNLISGLVADKEKALLAGHRISLMRNLSERCGVHYRGDLDKYKGRFLAGDAYALRLGTCVDSLLAINPKDFAGCDLVIDEVCQVLQHLLTSSTCNKSGKRPVLLMRFRALVQAAQRVILADADIDNKAIEYIHSLRGDMQPAFLVRNDYKAPGYPVQFIEAPDSSAITGMLLNDVRAGLRVFIATDSKGASKRLDRVISTLQEQLPKLLINSETSGGDVEQAFMTAPDQHLSATTLQVVTASPSAGTGLSIEGDHFDRVYGIFYGNSITDADMAQALLRVRASVPRVVWCAKHGLGFSKVGRQTHSLKLLNLLKQKTDANTLLIRASLSELGREQIATYDWANDPNIHYWADIEAQRNRSMWNLRTALKVRLMHEGHHVNAITLAQDNSSRQLLKEARRNLKVEHAVAVEASRVLTPLEAKILEDIDGLDPAQRLALERWHLAEFYCLSVEEVTADLVLWDNDGRRRSQLLNLEGFLDTDLATAADVRSLEKQAKWMQGITPWDISDVTLKQKVRAHLGMETFLEPGQQWTNASLTDFKQLALQLAPQIKAALNFSVKEEMAAVQILNQLLEQMGVECTSKQHRFGGGRIRTYQVTAFVWETSNAVLARRKERRQHPPEPVVPVTPSLSINQTREGCDADKAPEERASWQLSLLVLDSRNNSSIDNSLSENISISPQRCRSGVG